MHESTQDVLQTIHNAFPKSCDSLQHGDGDETFLDLSEGFGVLLT